jgi:hypothetical protein
MGKPPRIKRHKKTLGALRQGLEGFTGGSDGLKAKANAALNHQHPAAVRVTLAGRGNGEM